MKRKRLSGRLAVIFLILAMALSMVSGCSLSVNGKTKQSGQTVQTQEETKADTGSKVNDQAKEKGSGDRKDSGKEDKNQAGTKDSGEEDISEDKEYSSKEEVALYLHLYGHLPSNYITKNEAKDLGWDSSKGNLWKVAPGKSIGGDTFGNREGLLPKEKGRKYYECDIDYQGGRRGALRIVYSNDGLIYYTEDHYNTFELLYGNED